MSDKLPKNYFSDEARWQSWLDIEACLARVQASMGIIPQQAADDISSAADLTQFDLVTLRSEIEGTMAPVYALSQLLAKQCGESGAWVHWGATTQNIIDAGRLLVLRDVQTDLKQKLASCLTQLACLADEHADTAVIGRTNRQHALPITFGFKVGGWIDELLRICDQIEECEVRLFQLRFGGAIGAFQSFGTQGPTLTSKLAEELGMSAADFHGRAQVDVLIEYVSRLSMLGVAVYRIAGELFTSMQTEINEVSEDLGSNVIGSSTMPHKVNPKRVIVLQADANRLRAKAANAFSVTPPSHEGDAVTNNELRHLVEETCLLALKTASNLDGILGSINIHAQGMRDNLATSSEQTALEAIMMELAPKLGRAPAHDLLHSAVSESRRSGESLETIVRSIPQVQSTISEAALSAHFDPQQNTGRSAVIAHQLADSARARCKTLMS